MPVPLQPKLLPANLPSTGSLFQILTALLRLQNLNESYDTLLDRVKLPSSVPALLLMAPSSVKITIIAIIPIRATSLLNALRQLPVIQRHCAC